LGDHAFSHLNFDISWNEVAKYIGASPEATQITADLLNRYPDRFLFGTDEVEPAIGPRIQRCSININRCGTCSTKKRV
jgi:hypothetical protein